MVPAGAQVSSSSVPHGSKQSPAMQRVPERQFGSSRQMVHPVGPTSQRRTFLSVHCRAPLVHAFWQGGMQYPMSQRSPAPTSHCELVTQARHPVAWS